MLTLDTYAQVAPLWNVSRHLMLAGAYVVEMGRFPDRDRHFTAHVVRLKSQIAFDTRLSASAFVQYSSATDGVSTNLRFRYNLREGTDLWIVFNEGLNTDRHRSTPVLPLSDRRSLLVKYTHTFNL